MRTGKDQDPAKARSSLTRFVGYATPYWRYLSLSLLATILYVLLSAALIWLIGPLVGTLFGAETMPAAAAPSTAVGQGGVLANIKTVLLGILNGLVIRPEPLATLARLCIAVLLISLLKNALRYAQTMLVTVVQQRLVQTLRNELFRHFHNLSLAYFTRTRSGQIISHVVHDVRILNDMLEIGFSRLLRDPLLILALLGSLLVISWKLTLLALLVLPISAGVVALAGRYIRRYSRRSQERMADLSSILEESVGGVRIVKAFGMEDHEAQRFGRANSGYYRATVKMFVVRHFNSPINEVIGTAAGVSILWIGGRAVLGGVDLAPSEFMTYIFLMFSLIQPIKGLGNVHARISEGRAAADRVFEVLDQPIEIVDCPGARPMTDFTTAIAYENVSFHYEPGRPVLRGIDLTIPRGSSVALVGPSGGGKSTLCDLLTRFYDPVVGRISVDGIDIRDFQVSSWRAHLGVVTQDVILFNETVAANIAYGAQEPDPDRLRRAARAACALEFIEAMPQGFASVIGTRGLMLSGGQRQRLAVARAIYKDPPILIFDEATSALDTESEVAVQQAIDNLLRDRTVLIVAHRLSTVRHADMIVVVDGGRIVGSGTHDSLMARGGLYRRLYEMQFVDDGGRPAPDDADGTARPVL